MRIYLPIARQEVSAVLMPQARLREQKRPMALAA
jgi:hypothetical protein